MIPEEKSLVQHLQELKTELQEFFATRFELLQTELKESLGKIQMAGGMFAAAAAFGLVGLFLLGAFLALWISTLFGALADQHGLIWGFLIVGGILAVLAGILASAGMGRLRSKQLMPSRTIHVLRKDQEMVQRQGGSHEDEPPIRRGA